MVRAQVIYLDTHRAAALYQGALDGFSKPAHAAIDVDDDLRISPMVMLELEYLHEIKRIRVSGRRIVDALASDIGLTILAQARWARAPLITKDRAMHAHYHQAIE